MPAGVSHAIRMEGVVYLRTLLLDAHIERCQVIVVSGLLRELILAASRVLNLRDGAHARALILYELAAARRIDAFVPAQHGACVPGASASCRTRPRT
jgi:hypothetical protein